MSRRRPDVKKEAEEGGEFEVEEVLGERRVNGIRQLLIRWSGFPIEDASWEPYSQLSAAIRRMGRKRSVSKSPRKTPKGRKSRSVSRGRKPGTPKPSRKSTPAKKPAAAKAAVTPARSRSRDRLTRKSPGPKLSNSTPSQAVAQVARSAKAGANEVRRRVLPLVESRVAPQAKRVASRTRAHLRRWGTYYVLIASLLMISLVIYYTGASIQKSLQKYFKA